MDIGSEECGQFGSTLRERSGQTAGESLRNQEGTYTTDTTVNAATTTVNINTTVTTTTTDTVISLTTAGINTSNDTLTAVGNPLPCQSPSPVGGTVNW